jgi:peptidyl-tRNA hydrolase
MIKVYVRNDLNMRKGKMGAQVSHAVMSIFLNMRENNPNRIFFNEYYSDKILNWLKNPYLEIITVDSEDFILKKADENIGYCVLIKDQGRTEFNGVETLTCMAVCDIPLNNSHRNLCQPYKNVDCKQAIVINRDCSYNKIKVSEVSAIVSVRSIFQNSKYLDNKLYLDTNNVNFKDWLENAFAKIVLKSNTLEIEGLSLRLRSDNIKFSLLRGVDNNISAIAIGGDKISLIDSYTSDFKLY